LLVLSVLELFKKHLLSVFHFGNPILKVILPLLFVDQFLAILVHKVELVSSVVQRLDLLEAHLLCHNLSPEILFMCEFLAVIFVFGRLEHISDLVEILLGIQVVFLPLLPIIFDSLSPILLLHLVLHSLHF
jgi:hypothetical protein